MRFGAHGGLVGLYFLLRLWRIPSDGASSAPLFGCTGRAYVPPDGPSPAEAPGSAGPMRGGRLPPPLLAGQILLVGSARVFVKFNGQRPARAGWHRDQWVTSRCPA